MKALFFFLFILFFSEAMSQVEDIFSQGNIDPVYPGRNQIILTFDDGPTPGVTDKILDILQENKIKATFFVVGENVKKYPELMNRIVKEGHIVGNHSLSHIPLRKIDQENWKAILRSEVMDAHVLLLPYMANNPHYYFRAPGASWAKKYADFLNEDPIGKEYAGPILWDVGGEIEIVNGKYHQAADWACWVKNISVNDCLSGYLYEAIRKKGGVILMHDIKLQSVELLTKMIPELQNRGFAFVNLNEVDFKL